MWKSAWNPQSFVTQISVFFKEWQLTANMFSLGCLLQNVSKQSTVKKIITLYKDEGTFSSVGYIS